VTIEKGERYAQIAVIEKPQYEIVELEGDNWETFKKSQQRGDGGFGSSGK
jgi:dUTPase